MCSSYRTSTTRSGPICSIAWETVVALIHAPEEASGLEPSQAETSSADSFGRCQPSGASLIQQSGVER
jgi:hypothetical protein